MTAEQFKAAITAGASRLDQAVANTARLLKQAKADMQAGKMTVTQYQAMVEPNATWIHQFIGAGLSGGSQSANEVKAAGGEDILNTFFRYDPATSKFVTALPFTGTEWAQLPESSLPTREDVQKGLFDPKLAPMDRFRSDTPPPAPGAPGGEGGPPITPGVGVDGTITGGVPSGGITGGNTAPGVDERKLLDEANFADQLRQNTMTGNKTKQDQYMTDIAALLQKQQDATFKQMSPDIYEDLNTRGLLRSSALGDRMAKEAAILAGQTSTRLGELGLTQGLENLKQNTTNTAAHIADRGSAIGRRFSLEDFAMQLDAAQRLGSNTVPGVARGGGKGSAGDVITGAAAGSAGGVAGATLGGVGGLLGSKR